MAKKATKKTAVKKEATVAVEEKKDVKKVEEQKQEQVKEEAPVVEQKKDVKKVEEQKQEQVKEEAPVVEQKKDSEKSTSKKKEVNIEKYSKMLKDGHSDVSILRIFVSEKTGLKDEALTTKVREIFNKHKKTIKESSILEVLPKV